MGRKYVIETGFQSVSAAQDLLEALVPADAVMLVHELEIEQSSDDAATDAEHIQILLKRGIGSTSGSGGGSVTPVKLETGDAAAGIVVERNNTSQHAAGGGSLTTLRTMVFNVLAGLPWTPVPELRPVFSPGEYCVVSIAAPDDALTLNCRLTVEEIGG